MELCIENAEVETYHMTLLFGVLHKGSDEILLEVKKELELYDDIVEIIQGDLHLFNRLEVLVLGLAKILIGDKIIVPQRRYEHMCKIYELCLNDEGQGCIWEKEIPEFLKECKLKVGEFYCNPRSIYETTPEEKLENAISFIQDFYYHNRFKVMGEEDEFKN